MDRWPQRADRLPLGRRQCRSHSQRRDGIGRARTRRPPGPGHLDPGTAPAGDSGGADRVRARCRSGWRRLRGEPRASGRQCHRIYQFGIWRQREMVGATQRAPRATRVAVLRDPAIASGIGQFSAIQAVAPSLGVEVSPVNVRNASEIERGVAAVARSANGGLIVPAGGWAVRHRDLIIARAGQHKLPAVYYDRYFVTAGGLISYGPDLVDQYRQAAGYIDRILKGEKPADLPVQTPTKYQIVLNLTTAKTIGLEVPPTVLARADEVIE